MLDSGERIELLISRKLDGELTETEALELDRALVRSPEYRTWLTESERIDTWCASVLRNEVSSSAIECDRNPTTRIALGRRRTQRLWWCVPAAMAACVGWFAFTSGVAMGPADGLGLVGGTAPVLSANDGPDMSGMLTGGGPTMMASPLGGIRQASTGAGRMDRRTDSEILSVVGDDGKIYLIEVQRTQALQRPSARSDRRLSVDEL